ncbi:MAG TPA: cbb3-type cytochrome c oxidase subunit I [Candidatus Dormibacteraeota bacterium]|nr:cbb3-type cytochrome c oxidase subunit I [Candidatus Dormibacteraeota bacterium]
MSGIVAIDNPVGKRVMWTYIATGLAIFLLMVLVGIAMRASQAGWLTIDPGTFYSLLSLHGVGMITAMAIAGLGILWYLVSRYAKMNAGVAYLAFGFFLAGVVCVIVSVVPGHYGALWTMLYPLPFTGTYWPSWATGSWLIGNSLVMIGFMIWCAQILGALLERFGGIRGVLAIDYVFRNRAFIASGQEPPPPEMFAAAITAIDGFIGGTAGLLIVIAMIVHWIDPTVAINPLWAKNLIYQFGHTFANLTMYMAVAGVYVGLPMCTKREYHTSVPLAVAWWGTLTFVIIAYFHHLYMDFAQVQIVQYIGEISSYLAAIPVVVVTVYGGVMLVHRSGMKWSLGSMFLFAGMIGWVVGGSAAVLDATIPINVDLHNTLWVPGHFHTYLLEGVLLFVMGWAFVSLEQRAGTASNLVMRWLIGLGMFGGGALFLMPFYMAGAAGVPRRYASEPAPGPYFAGIATIGAVILLIGFLLAVFEALRLARLKRAGAVA